MPDFIILFGLLDEFKPSFQGNQTITEWGAILFNITKKNKELDKLQIQLYNIKNSGANFSGL